ncbi:MAG: alanine-zipper protein, partial [Desulforhopalus sp.]
MGKRRKALLIGASAVMAMQAHLADTVEAKQVMVDSKVLEQLQQLVADQQKQLDSLQRQVNQFQQTAVEAQAQAQEAKSVAEEAKTTAETPASKVVTSGQERISLAVSGQIDRAMNVVDDGDKTDVYFVDNENSNSRVRFVGKAIVDEDLTLGSRLEIAFSPNNSSRVSQNDQETSDFTDIRWADVSLGSKRYGTIFLGKGDTASNNTAEVDLSGTGVIAYTSVSSIAGG